MNSKLAAVVVAVAASLMLIGGGVAIGASTHHSVRACSKRSNHSLALLKHGRCAKGYAKVTLGARGQRGARGPAGPGAVYDTLTGPNNDEQVTFPGAIDGLTIATNCGAAANVSISIGATGPESVDASGTKSEDSTLSPVDESAQPSVGAMGLNQADLDIVARVTGGAFVHFDVHGTWAGGACHYWMVAIPASSS
jgi:hypothetical protein